MSKQKITISTKNGVLTPESAKVLRQAGIARYALCGNPWHGSKRRFIARPRAGWAVTLADIPEPEITGDGYEKWTATFKSGWTETFFNPSTLAVVLPIEKYNLQPVIN